MGRRVRIFHISDLHARSTNGPQAERAAREAPSRRRVLGKEWEDNLAELRADGTAVDLVVFTGDLGDWGHGTDYTMGVEFLRRTCAVLGVPIERLFVVPGNHDIARKTEEERWKALREKMAQGGLRASDWMAGGSPPPGFEDDWRDAVLHRQESFWHAVTVDLGRGELAPWQNRHKRLGYQVRVPLDGLDTTLWIIGLDTSWLAGDESDTGKLWLTEHQIELVTADYEGVGLPGFRLALMHHRFADLADGDRAPRLMADRVDLLLHGHQHEPMVEPWTSPDHALLVLAAGCLYEGDEQHRYPNACQMLDVELSDDTGRPGRVSVRFRGWADRNGLFWGDDWLLYKSARGGRLELERLAHGWQVRGEAPRVPPWMPASSEVFVGRGAELRKLDEAMRAGAGARVAVVAVQGMAGVGKSFLVEQFCAKNRVRFGTICRWVLDPANPPTAAHGLLEIARQAGFDVDRIPPKELATVLNEREILVHIDNVDGREAATLVGELLGSLPQRPAIVTGRYMALGTTPGSGWQRVEVESLDADTSVALLRKELGGDAPSEAQMRGLASELGGLPLAIHLAAGYLRSGYTAEDFLGEFRSRLLALPPVDPVDPTSKGRSRGIVAVAFEISRSLFLAEATKRGKDWDAALSALGWAPLVGFGRSLGAAIVDVPADEIGPFLQAATALSLVRRVEAKERPDGAWSVHPLVAEFLRTKHARGPIDERITFWVAKHADGNPESRSERWAVLSRESSAVHWWLAEADDESLTKVLPRCWEYGSSHGPVRPWLDAARRASKRLHPARAKVAWAWAQLASQVGELSEVLQAAEIVRQEGDGERDRALAAGLGADILVARGELDEGLRIRREEALPVYERLGDVRSKAVTMGQIADILVAQGNWTRACASSAKRRCRSTSAWAMCGPRP
ncbi:MAG: metallophosphoesterase [Myxococcales bacterium]|nr:metallophosphoesterase [Myxococcales bacterium]